MTDLKFTIKPSMDATKILEAVLSFFGTLAVTRGHWGQLLGAMGWKTPHFCDLGRTMEGFDMGVDNAAKALLDYAVPEEGEIHPQRGLFCTPLNSNYIELGTAGGVIVSLTVGEDRSVAVGVQFNRDSTFAARCLIGRLYEVTGGEIDLA